MSARTNMVRIATGLNRAGVLPRGWTALHKGMKVEVVWAWTKVEIIVTSTGANAPGRPGWAPVIPRLKRDYVDSIVEQVGALAHRLERERL